MELVTHFEAATRSTADLRALLKMAFAACASALTSIHTIEIELARRSPCP